jgi:hypothetical protein
MAAAIFDCLGINLGDQEHDSYGMPKIPDVKPIDVLDKLISGWATVQELRGDELGVLGASSRQISILTWADTVKGIAAVLFTIAALGVLIGLILATAGIVVAPLLISASLATGFSLAGIGYTHREQARALEWVSRQVEELRNQIFLQMSV